MDINFAPTLLGVAGDLAKSFVGAVSAGAIAYAWYWFGPRNVESKWVRNSGLLFYVYYRNLDWRCETIRQLSLGIWNSDSREDQFRHFERELNKLKADIDCLDRITDLWADRVAGFPGWYPYKVKVSELIEASTHLSISLTRHVDPVLWYIAGKCGSEMPTLILGESAESSDIQRYMAYFNGNIERMWSRPTETFPITAEREAIVATQNDGRLFNRLDAVLRTLLTLLEKKGLDPEELKKAMPAWGKQGCSKQVWLIDNPVVEDPATVATSSS